MQALRTDLPPLPPRFQALPLDERGYPVPWFVAWIDGQPDFRVVRENGIAIAHNEKRCWLCGEKRGRFGAFVIGPMCAVNRVSSEPPSHLDCAQFAATACPFLTRPMAKRNERDMPDETKAAAGEMIKRNPGVALVWVTERYDAFRAPGGVLFQLGDPHDVFWYAHGRAATRQEVLASIDSGLPLLNDMAAKEGVRALDALSAQLTRALDLVPA